MANAEKIAELIKQVPDLDQKGTFTGPSWEDANKLIEGILKEGGSGIEDVVKMLVDVDDGTDYRARYVLHAMAIYVGDTARAKEKALFNKALTQQLQADRPKAVKGYLIRQLQVSGDGSVAGALGQWLLDEELFADALMALSAIRTGAEDAFKRALPKAEGKIKVGIEQALASLK